MGYDECYNLCCCPDMGAAKLQKNYIISVTVSVLPETENFTS